MKKHCAGITMFQITDQDILLMEDLVEGGETSKTFKGTLKVHQFVFDPANPTLCFRSLSCFECKGKGLHFHIGDGFEQNENSFTASRNEVDEMVNAPGTSRMTSSNPSHKPREG